VSSVEMEDRSLRPEGERRSGPLYFVQLAAVELGAEEANEATGEHQERDHHEQLIDASNELERRGAELEATAGELEACRDTANVADSP